jgi:hypothetical protein
MKTKIVLFLLSITFLGCQDNLKLNRRVLYRIHPVNSGLVEFQWLDSAYRSGDTLILAGATKLGVYTQKYVIEGRTK